MSTAQLYCTIAEVDQDLNLLGSEPAGNIYAKIQAASAFLAKEIGWFLPVVDTRVLTSPGGNVLFLPPLLRLDSLTSDGVSLAPSDYLLGPGARHWPDGPYSWIELASYGQLGAWSVLNGGIVLAGLFGLYDHSESFGATLGADQGVSVETLQASNGAAVSPGMVLVIGSEHQLVTGTGSSPTAVTTLAQAVDAAAETLQLANASLVQIGETFRIGLEQFRLLDRNGNAAYVTRGWNRTARVPHATSDSVEVYRTFSVQRAANGTTAAAHTSGAALSRQMVPQDINFLAREIAGKMLKFSQSGFAGRIGDDVTGQSYFNFAIPRIELDQIKRNYIVYTAG